MGGTTTTCPICGITRRIHYDYCDERDYDDTPFYIINEIVYCRRCKLPAVATWGLNEYAKKIYEQIGKFDRNQLNDCIHKGYFAEAILMLHIQIVEQLSFLLLQNLPKEKNKETKDFLENAEAYSIINLAILFEHISSEEFEVLLILNKMRNKFAHTFWDRKKWDFTEIRRIIDSSKKIEERLSNSLKKN